ncbi:hypothetical protein AAFF_G00042790 [Aldrovandia affinis]|uniref:Uncharacterized protein n=1 Tax=Aldrovandia affinis TaxID=143900 RepID=A0AAD7WG28_9TELE|nr:hypothetical protein AAFF_G00042790 [Aldrovandia affinis]
MGGVWGRSRRAQQCRGGGPNFQLSALALKCSSAGKCKGGLDRDFIVSQRAAVMRDPMIFSHSLSLSVCLSVFVSVSLYLSHSFSYSLHLSLFISRSLFLSLSYAQHPSRGTSSPHKHIYRHTHRHNPDTHTHTHTHTIQTSPYTYTHTHTHTSQTPPLH